MGKRKSSPRLATTPEKMLLLAVSPVNILLYINRKFSAAFNTIRRLIAKDIYIW
jgi:hypothetical protein